MGADPGYSVIGALYGKLPWDHASDLVPVAMYARTPFAIIVGGTSRFKTMPELLVYARANPGKVTFASPGVGSVGHIVYEAMLSEAKVKMTHVPYKGGGEALGAVIGNTVDVLITAPPTILGHMKSGAVKVLAMTSNKRWPAADSVPTLLEQGVNFTSWLWFGLMAPQGTPQPAMDYLQQQVVAVLKDPRTKESLDAAGVEGVEMSPQELGRMIREDTGLWKAAAKAANISAE